MNYPVALKYLESFVNYEKIPEYPYKQSLKLERVKDFLDIIGNPQDSLRCIHIAGTKGKGSTCAFVAYILREAGYKVGLYTSPHLSDFRERIRVLRGHSENEFAGMISRKDLTMLVKGLRSAIDKYNQTSGYGPLSFFEVYTALAFTYFKEKKVDFAVLETGLGGRLDATNVTKPLVCAITPISYEHTQKLGNTLREIAAEKAGIIKNCRAVVVSAPQKNEAVKVIRGKCKEVGAQLTIKNTLGNYRGLKIPLLGSHQRINAAVAIGIIEALQRGGARIGIDAIKKGINQTKWPGRCEIVSRSPTVILDGAQNIASVEALIKAIQDNFEYKKLILIFGISKDKDIRGVAQRINKLADIVILTEAGNPRAAKSSFLAEFFPGKKIYPTCKVRDALKAAKAIAKDKDLILVTGSLFVVGEARESYDYR